MSPTESEDSPRPDGGPGGFQIPLLDHLRIEPAWVGPGQGRVELTVGPEHLRTLGIMHGGIAATLLDSALGMAAGTLAPEGHYVVTVQLNVNFIRPAWEGETLVANGEVRHSGRKTAVSFGEIRTSAGTLVATASGTFMYLPRPDPEHELIPRTPE